VYLALTGLSHKTAPVSLRERVAVEESRAGRILQELKARGAAEAALLSTCNRTELFAVAPTPEEARRVVDETFHALARTAGASGAELEPSLYRFQDGEAARHLFSVAAGLDSLVIGEVQILGQVRRAHEIALDAGSAGPVISQLFSKGVHVGKRVRQQTRISEGAASISYAAVELARKIFDTLAGRRILIVGAGKMGVLAAKNLKGQGAHSLYVANRTRERADELAARIGAQTVPFSTIESFLAEVDIVITSTGAPEPIITAGAVSAAMRRRRGEPLFLIDIAVPRDIDPRVHDMEGVFLYNIDDLSAVVQANLAEREQCVAEARRIVDQEAARFSAWLRERLAVPVITALRQKVRETTDQEVERFLRRLSHLPEREKEQVRALARAIAGKILHEPTIRLKSSVMDGTHHETFRTVSDLFGLDLGGTSRGARTGLGTGEGVPS